MNISSLIIKVKEDKFEEVLKTLQNSDYCEVHLFENQKIVVTIEGYTTDDEIKALKKIEQLKGVLSAEMAYAYSEQELETERQKIEIADDVPSWLNDNTIKAENIRYKGDLRKKDL